MRVMPRAVHRGVVSVAVVVVNPACSADAALSSPFAVTVC